MAGKSGSPRLYLVSSTPPRDRRPAQRVAVMLEQCRQMLIEGNEPQTVRLLDIALLQLRMSLCGVSDAELTELCAALARADRG